MDLGQILLVCDAWQHINLHIIEVAFYCSSVKLCCFVFPEPFLQIDQKINELVAEQQKNDAKVAHDKSELEQLRQDLAIADKQKQSILKSLEKKVLQ